MYYWPFLFQIKAERERDGRIRWQIGPKFRRRRKKFYKWKWLKNEYIKRNGK